MPSPSPTSTKGVIRLAVVVGHNENRPGAYAPHPIGKSEFVFNSEVARLMVRLANVDDDIEVKVFYRKPMSEYWLEIDEVYRRVNAWDPDVALELHFNWLNKAGRVEMVHYPKSVKSRTLASSLLRSFTGLMKVGMDKAKLLPRGKRDRGGRSLWACKCPIVLTEPFDCSNIDHLLRVEELGTDSFARAYLDTVKSFARLHLS